MTITITTAGDIIKPKKARKATVKARRGRAVSERRVYPPNGEKMSTMAYIHAYHAANASVCLTMVDYVCT